jgi:CRP-like cAMP-binding protein
MDQQSIISTIRNLDFFKGLNDQDLDDISQIFIHTTYQTGDKIIVEGDEQNKDLFLLISGKAITKIETKKDEQEANIHVIEEGSIFGELALVTNQKRTATVEATSATELLQLPKQSFDELSERNNHLGMVIYRNVSQILAERIRKSNKMLRHTILWGW